MADWKSHLLPALFLLHGGINLMFYGFPAVMFSAVIPASLYGKLAWALPFLILGYFALGILALYHLLIHNVRRGKLLGLLYFGAGALGSAVVLSESLHEMPLLPAIFALWLALSLLGMLLLFRGIGVSWKLSLVAMTLLGISALVSASTAQWVVEDYYAHVHIGEIPENATVIVAYPENVSPPNGTG
ncbi:hypothetical protein [Thermococcus sp. JdF3]|uniref:hypothetical protein n=1 Tax=Thermococcus sp. JdF3 TaxID=1638258 RepID=UPI00143B491C|nr:hypothetical protein [Thermococcus sp. JdF3]NJE00329.1 hypothetical protein [Thermococcus sp. JdF3]